jgi:hypothetical protein
VTIHWTSAAKKKARPGRGSSFAARRPERFNVDPATKAVANAFVQNAETWAAGDSKLATDLIEVVAAAREGLGAGAFFPAEPHVEGVRAALVADHERTGKDVVASSLVPLWVHAQGAAFALDALLVAVLAGVQDRAWTSSPLSRRRG